jgi:hypothetical protein
MRNVNRRAACATEQEKLSIAISGKGAFRRFKDVLFAYDDEEKAWFKFKEDRMKGIIDDWLLGYDLEPLEEGK